MSKTTELLDSLRDIHEPVPPEALSPIWMLLAALASVVILGFLLFSFFTKRQKKKSPWADQVKFARSEEPEQARLRLARLLRHISLVTHKDDCSQLIGTAWLEHLDKQYSTEFFTNGAGRLFGESLYKPLGNNTNMNEVCDEITVLIKQLKPARLHSQPTPVTSTRSTLAQS